MKLDPDFRRRLRRPRGGRACSLANTRSPPTGRSDSRRALRRGRDLVEKALSLEPLNGDAYLQSAHMTTFDDLSDAEKDYRRGLELNPNAAKGYAGLAAVVYERRRAATRRSRCWIARASSIHSSPLTTSPRRCSFRSSALTCRERTRCWSTCSSVTRGTRRRSRGSAGREMLKQAANSIRYCEQALALDPSREWTRRTLIRAYVDLGDMSAARQLVEDEGSERSPRQLCC